MFCRNCANPMDDKAVVCVKCGVRKGDGNSFCPNCGSETAPEAAICVNCGVELRRGASSVVPSGYTTSPGVAKSKTTAGLLGIFLGGFGVHNFYLGKTGIAIAQIAVTLITCGMGSLWGFIEGILILAGKINTDGYGNYLED